jgi:nitrogen fixation protein
MKRKTFLLLTTVVLAGVIVPVYVSHKKYAALYKPLLFPESLSKLFDKNAIKEIGIAYRSKNLSESDANRLKQLLLTDSSGKVYNEEDKILMREMLNKATKKDFETGKIIVVNGWVLSLTEARQCALFSLTEV